jgi:phage anti-repressor protein
MDVHLWTRSIHFYFFSKNLDFVWGVDRVRSRRELKDKIFAKLRKTNVKIIAKNAKNRKEKRYFLKNIKTNDFGNAKLI